MLKYRFIKKPLKNQKNRDSITKFSIFDFQKEVKNRENAYSLHFSFGNLHFLKRLFLKCQTDEKGLLLFYFF